MRKQRATNPAFVQDFGDCRVTDCQRSKPKIDISPVSLMDRTSAS